MFLLLFFDFGSLARQDKRRLYIALYMHKPRKHLESLQHGFFSPPYLASIQIAICRLLYILLCGIDKFFHQTCTVRPNFFDIKRHPPWIFELFGSINLVGQGKVTSFLRLKKLLAFLWTFNVSFQRSSSSV